MWGSVRTEQNPRSVMARYGSANLTKNDFGHFFLCVQICTLWHLLNTFSAMFCMKIAFNAFKRANKECLSKFVELFWIYFGRKAHCLTLDDGPKSSEKSVMFGTTGEVNLSSLFHVPHHNCRDRPYISRRFRPLIFNGNLIWSSDSHDITGY